MKRLILLSFLLAIGTGGIAWASSVVGYEAESFDLGANTSIVGNGVQFFARGARISKQFTTGNISRASIYAKRGKGNCSGYVTLYTQHQNSDGTWAQEMNQGSVKPGTSYGWFAWTINVQTGTNKLIYQQTCDTSIAIDRGDYTDDGSTPPPSPPSGSLVVGEYAGWHNWTGVDSFYSWLSGYSGEKWAHEFVDHNYGWSTIGDCLNSGWSNWVNVDDAHRRFSMSLPLMPTSTPGDFAGVLVGTYDSYWRQCANELKSGPADTVIRLGWEANGNTFPWSIPPNNTTALNDYKAAWAHVVNVMHSVDPNLKFEWNMNAMLDYSGYPLEQMYPGDDVVDYVSASAYDYCNERCQANGQGNTFNNRWNSWVGNGIDDNGLQHSYNFAIAHGKQINETEWGLWPAGRAPGGGGDDPQYIDAMSSWLSNHGAAYEIYNDVSDHALNNYPNAQAEYKIQFGA